MYDDFLNNLYKTNIYSQYYNTDLSIDLMTYQPTGSYIPKVMIA